MHALMNLYLVLAGSSRTERYAAEELHRYLTMLTGESIAIVDWNGPLPPTVQPSLFTEAVDAAYALLRGADPPVNAASAPSHPVATVPTCRFVLGTPATCAEIAEQEAWLLSGVREDSDGYRVATSKDGRTVFIAAHHPRGVLFGVYDYLGQRGGVGFFEDAERVPESSPHSLLPPFAPDDAPDWTEVPAFDTRGQWIWTRYYGANRGHAANWGYEEWVSHLRWLAQRRSNLVLLHVTGYTRLWGEAFYQAFPEARPFLKAEFPEATPFWGARWTARAGWGRSPEEQTNLMRRVLQFGRECLGLQFQFIFYVGSFEETLKLAYPEGQWTGWECEPHHAYYGAAGRSTTLAITDPRAKELNQRLWRAVIEAYGTDHDYMIGYREESLPGLGVNAPDKGLSLGECIARGAEWITEIDPEARVTHWDWHTGWLFPDGDVTENDYELTITKRLTHHEIRDRYRRFCASVPATITFANTAHDGPWLPCEWPLRGSDCFAPHPWVFATLIGFGGLDVPNSNTVGFDAYFRDMWATYLHEKGERRDRLHGVIHLFEITQVSPLFDHLVTEMAWTGRAVGTQDDIRGCAGPLRDFFARRYGANAKTLHCVEVTFCDLFPATVPTCRIPDSCLTKGLETHGRVAAQRIQDALARAVSVRDRQRTNPVYATQIVDWSRAGLHNLARADMAELNGIVCEALAEPSGEIAAAYIEQFDRVAARGIATLAALGDILATDRRHSLSDSIYRMTHEPGANPLLRRVMLEHASGLLFNGYALNDTPEFFRAVTVPRLAAHLDAMRRTIRRDKSDTGLTAVTIPLWTAMNGNHAALGECYRDYVNALDLERFQRQMLDMPARPFDSVRDTRHPAEILACVLELRSSL